MTTTTCSSQGGEKADLLSALKLVNQNLGRERATLAVSVLSATVSVAFELLPILLTYSLIRMLVDGTAQAQDFLFYGLILVATIPLGYALFGLSTSLSHKVAFALIHGLRLRLASHLTRLPLGYFSHRTSGAVRKLLVDEPERLELLVAHAIPEGASAFASWLAISFWLLWVDWRMALSAMLLTPVSFFLMGLAIRRALPQMLRYRSADTLMNSAVGEFLAGISAIKVFSRANQSRTKAENAIRDFTDRKREMGRHWLPLGGTFYAFVTANICVILPLGVWLYSTGSLRLPELLFFVIVGGNYSLPLMRLFNLFQQFAHISIAAGLLQDTFEEAEQEDSQAALMMAGHDVAFEGVNFSYDMTPALSDVSFVAQTGQTTALVGPSGSGKSTIAHLIARFYDVQQGTICIGKANIALMSRAQLMRTVSIVFQDTFLFSGTIAENLRFARPDASEDDLHSAARAAQAHEFIMALSQGYQTMIGEGGQALSGGEKQRIAIARAILKDAPVIVLDEATAFADPDCEAEIQAAISALTARKTVIVVAHRLHTIAAADQVLVLDRGCLVERGVHSDLVSAGGLYAQMWRDYIATRNSDLRGTAQ